MYTVRIHPHPLHGSLADPELSSTNGESVMTSEAQPLRDHYTLKWHDDESETVLDINLMEDKSLSLSQEGNVRDPVSRELEPVEGALLMVTASQVDRFVEAIVLIQLKRKEHPQDPKPNV